MNFNPRHLLLGISFVCLLLTLSACGLFQGDPPIYGDVTALAINGPAYMVCSPSCSINGQCGTLENGAKVVFVNGGNAVTQNHNGILNHNYPTTIVQLESRSVVPMARQNEVSSTNFYKVSFTNANDGTIGEVWVAGWCVADRVMAD